MMMSGHVAGMGNLRLYTKFDSEYVKRPPARNLNDIIKMDIKMGPDYVELI
jgi:hypothetical protein